MPSMTLCIYCKEPLVPKGPTPDPKNPSLEHIVPFALGGSDGCSTTDACKECNSDLGHTVDSACINHTLVKTLRQQFGIASYSGNVPDVAFGVRSSTGNEPARMIIPPEGEVTFKHEPVVLRQDHPLGEEVLVVGTEDDVSRIVNGMAAKAAKSGKMLIDPATGKPMDVAASIAAAPRDPFDEYRLPVPNGREELIPIHRQIVKIAFGFSHLVLGPAWSGSPDANAMRAVARGLGGDSDVDALVIGIDANVRTILPMGSAKPTDHLLVLMLAQEPLVVVSLFGEPLMTAAVRLDADRDILEEGLATSDRLMATIDPQTRQTTWVGLVDVVAHIAGVGAR
jgi:HNH endonuclease